MSIAVLDFLSIAAGHRSMDWVGVCLLPRRA